MVSRQFLTFLLTGAIAAAVNFGSRIVLSHWLNYSAAILLAYVAGMITAFLLARAFVFPGGQQDIHRSILFFIAVNLIAVAQTWAVSMAMARAVLPALGVATFVPEIAHACGVVVPVFTSYLGHKYWSFR
jgi:putative flippase GtrA